MQTIGGKGAAMLMLSGIIDALQIKPINQGMRRENKRFSPRITPAKICARSKLKMLAAKAKASWLIIRHSMFFKNDV